jgi:gamma-glutamylcyclotransferase (GGCT)/AIG2-like uncharacterized protein YtfP
VLLRTPHRATGLAFLPDRAHAPTPASDLAVVLRAGHVVAGLLAPGDRQAPDLEALRPDGTSLPVHLPPCADPDVVRRLHAEHGLDPAPLDDLAAGRPPRSLVPRVFVYGTLMRRGGRHRALLRHAPEAIVAAACPGLLVDLGAYPGMILDRVPPGATVHGELVEFGTGALGEAVARLDAIEGFRGFGAPGSLYVRRLVHVTPSGRAAVLAWTYVYAGDLRGARPIASGDWRRRPPAP